LDTISQRIKFKSSKQKAGWSLVEHKNFTVVLKQRYTDNKL